MCQIDQPCPDAASSCDPAALPRPRLILRVGGMGNRKFGKDSGIDQEPDQIEQSLRRACDEVFAQIETALDGILKEDRSEKTIFRRPVHRTLQRWKTHGLALIFGRKDRWNWDHLDGASASVFACAPPLVKVLTGGEDGGDRFIKETAGSRNQQNAANPGQSGHGPVSYEHFVITPEDPSSVPGGLGIGIGSNPPSQPGRPAALNNEQQPVFLPASREEAASRARIAQQRACGFRAQSEALRHHSDVLVAIWDPAAAGKPGGTAESVASALQERIPVIAILVQGPGEDALVQVLQSVSDLRSILKGECLSNDWRADLERVLHGVLKFPDLSPEKFAANPTTADPRAVFAAFLDGKPLTPMWPGFFWSKTKKPGARPEPELIPGTFEFYCHRVKRRADSDGMSGIFGDAHRGGVVLSYFLAPAAVLLTISGAIMIHHHAPVWMLAVLAALELLAIILMYALSVCSKIEDWHEAFVDTRILAEALRMMKFLGPLGIHTPLPKLPHFLRDAPPESYWPVWYFRTLIRAMPLRLARTPKKDKPVVSTLKEARDELVRDWITVQIRHHEKTRSFYNSLKHTVIRWCDRVFAFVFLCALVHVVQVIADWHWAPWDTVAVLICVTGPAVIGALHGFTSQIEAARLRRRSDSMVQLLEERVRVLNSLDLESNPSSAEAVWGLASEALQTGAAMMDETASWSLLYRNADINPG